MKIITKNKTKQIVHFEAKMQIEMLARAREYLNLKNVKHKRKRNSKCKTTTNTKVKLTSVT